MKQDMMDFLMEYGWIILIMLFLLCVLAFYNWLPGLNNLPPNNTKPNINMINPDSVDCDNNVLCYTYSNLGFSCVYIDQKYLSEYCGGN